MQLLDLHDEGIITSEVPRERFELLRGEGAMTTYTFDTDVAKHTFCRHCGIHSFYMPRSAPDGVSVMPAPRRCRLAEIARHPFDGQHWEEFMAARQAKA